MKDIGLIVKQRDVEGLFMLMEMCMMVIGKTTKLTDMEFILIWMALVIKETGRKTNNMVKVTRPGQTEHLTKELTSKVKSMDMDASHGLMAVRMMVIL